MALDPSNYLAADGELELAAFEEMVTYMQDLKCLLCGFVLGQLHGPPSVSVDARTFIPYAGQVAPSGFRAARARCFRCGGPCFLDELETRLLVRHEALEKPRRGRKPKPRP